jgi:hypothetical protein
MLQAECLDQIGHVRMPIRPFPKLYQKTPADRMRTKRSGRRAPSRLAGPEGRPAGLDAAQRMAGLIVHVPT